MRKSGHGGRIPFLPPSRQRWRRKHQLPPLPLARLLPARIYLLSPSNLSTSASTPTHSTDNCYYHNSCNDSLYNLKNTRPQKLSRSARRRASERKKREAEGNGVDTHHSTPPTNYSKYHSQRELIEEKLTPEEELRRALFSGIVVCNSLLSLSLSLSLSLLYDSNIVACSFDLK